MFRKYQKDRCYIIAEIGGNFTNFDQACRLIDEAAACGVDAVKLQTYRADTLASKKAMFDFENTGRVGQYELFKQYEISEPLHKQIFEYAQSKDLDWFSTPSHPNDVDMLERLGVGAHKVGSDDSCNLPFLDYIARTGKPVLLATGMSTLGEVREAVDNILRRGNAQIYLFHAVSCYPAHSKDINLRAMQTMKQAFPNIPVGYSDHTLGTNAAVCAAAMGADLIEKHFTYDKNAEGPDHLHSADPAEMKEIVERVRDFEVLRGHGIKCPSPPEVSSRYNTRKSIVLQKTIEAGQRITPEHICIKRPGHGIEPRYFRELIGRTAGRTMQAEEALTWEDL